MSFLKKSVSTAMAFSGEHDPFFTYLTEPLSVESIYTDADSDYLEPQVLYVDREEYERFDLDDVIAAIEMLENGMAGSVMLQAPSPASSLPSSYPHTMLWHCPDFVSTGMQRVSTMSPWPMSWTA